MELQLASFISIFNLPFSIFTILNNNLFKYILFFFIISYFIFSFLFLYIWDKSINFNPIFLNRKNRPLSLVLPGFQFVKRSENPDHTLDILSVFRDHKPRENLIDLELLPFNGVNQIVQNDYLVSNHSLAVREIALWEFPSREEEDYFQFATDGVLFELPSIRQHHHTLLQHLISQEGNNKYVRSVTEILQQRPYLDVSITGIQPDISLKALAYETYNEVGIIFKSLHLYYHYHFLFYFIILFFTYFILTFEISILKNLTWDLNITYYFRKLAFNIFVRTTDNKVIAKMYLWFGLYTGIIIAVMLPFCFIFYIFYFNF